MNTEGHSAETAKEHSSSFKGLTLLFGAMIVFTVGWLLFPQYFIASDPWRYSQAAFDIVEHGEVGASHVFRHRFGLTLPVALFYALFGVNILATNLWMLVCALLVIGIAWYASVDLRSKTITMGLALLCAPLWTFSVQLYPDLAAAAFMSASVLFLSLRHDEQRNPKLTAALGVASLFVAFLSKESAYWALPIWAWVWVDDVRARTGRSFWFTSAAVGLLLGSIYLICCYAIWGDPLARFRAVQELTGRHLWAWEGQDSGLLSRVTVQPPWFYLRTYGLLFVFSLLGMLTCPRRLRIWSNYLIITIGLFWIGSTSFSEYEPLPLMPRMILPSLPPMLILAGAFLAQVVERVPKFHVGAIFAGLIGLNMMLHSTGIVFASAANADPHETRAAAFLRDVVLQRQPGRVLVVTSDVRSVETLPFFFGYRPPAHLTFVEAADLDVSTDAQSFDEVYAYLHRSRSKYLLKSYGNPNADAIIEQLNLPVAFAAGDVHLFAVPAQRRAALIQAVAAARDLGK